MAIGKQVVLIVGASRGIGRQVAIDLAKNGYAGKSIFHPSFPPKFDQLTLTRHLL